MTKLSTRLQAYAGGERRRFYDMRDEAEALEEKAALLEHLREEGLWIRGKDGSMGFSPEAQPAEEFYANLKSTRASEPEGGD